MENQRKMQEIKRVKHLLELLMVDLQLAHQEIERLMLWQKVMEDQRPRLAWNNKPIETEREREREREKEMERERKAEMERQEMKKKVKQAEETIKVLEREIETLKEMEKEIIFERERDMRIAENEKVKLVNGKVKELEREVERLKEDMTTKEIQYKIKFERAKEAYRRQNERVKQFNQNVLVLDREVVRMKEEIRLKDETEPERTFDRDRERENDWRRSEEEMKNRVEREMEMETALINDKKTSELEEVFKKIKIQLIELENMETDEYKWKQNQMDMEEKMEGENNKQKEVERKRMENVPKQRQVDEKKKEMEKNSEEEEEKEDDKEDILPPDKSIRRRAVDWVNKKWEKRNLKKIERTYQREAEEGYKIVHLVTRRLAAPSHRPLYLEGFVGEVRKVFDDPFSGTEAACKLIDLRHDARRVADYALDFRMLAVESAWNPEALFDMFQHGVSEEVKDKLAAGELPTGLDSHRFDIPTQPLFIPIDVRALNVRSICRVTHNTTPINLWVSGNHSETIQFLLIKSPQIPVVLGFSWTKRHNPLINWSTGAINGWSPFCHGHCLNSAQPAQGRLPGSS
ncbi:trichohyalin-like [Salmo salar]|uniref:Trichohyalin-like n=1 Tax=Salmo salar TaxID=8030 RepID=A0ABM3EGD4_SALSA|nr:trichohyalin-like [Salmo salar]